MDNGCPKCKELANNYDMFGTKVLELCLDCQLEQAEHNVMVAMNKVEELKQKIKEKKDAECR